MKRNLPRSQRSIISKLKCGVLPIALETGRWTDVKEEKRLCVFCPSKCVETEEHFLTVCTVLDDVRESDLTQLNAIRDISSLKGIDKMKEMFKPDLIKATARMVEEMFQTRKSLMYEAVVEDNDNDNILDSSESMSSDSASDPDE